MTREQFHELVIKLARGNILVIKHLKMSAKSLDLEKYGEHGGQKTP